MAKTITSQQSSLVHLQTLNNQHNNKILKSNNSFSLKFPLYSTFTHLKHSNYQIVPTKALLTSFLEPFCEPLLSTSVKFNSDPVLHGGGWAHDPVHSGMGRADFRVWSRRRPGSKNKDKRLIIDLECNVCLKNRYTTERHKDFAKRTTEKEKHKNMKKPSNLLEEHKTNKSQGTNQEGKEKRRLKREAKMREVNNSNILMLFKFCPKCRQSTLHKEVK